MFRALIKDLKLNFGPLILIKFEEFLHANEGKYVTIELVKPEVSDELRGYYYGAVIPFMKHLVDDWNKISDDQIHEILKKNFNYFEAFNPLTKRNERYGQSIMGAGNTGERGREFIASISEWVLENYQRHLPDPEKYKKWRDTAPSPEEKYNDE